MDKTAYLPHKGTIIDIPTPSYCCYMSLQPRVHICPVNGEMADEHNARTEYHQIHPDRQADRQMQKQMQTQNKTGYQGRPM